MTQTELIALAERVDAATGSDRELDAAVGRACGKRYIGLTGAWFPHTPASEVYRSYTSSLDAAMSLVPSGFILRNYQASRFVQHSCEVALSWAHGGWIGNSDHSFALALTAAALRARAAQEQ